MGRRRTSTPEKATCRSCGADILWLKTKNGKNTPVNFASTAKVLVRTEGERLAPTGAQSRVVQAYVSHFETCPSADNHRGQGTENSRRNRMWEKLQAMNITPADWAMWREARGLPEFETLPIEHQEESVKWIEEAKPEQREAIAGAATNKGGPDVE